MEDLIKKFPVPENSDIRLKEITNVGDPHLYCITPKHLLPGRMILDEAAIKEAEEKGAVCDFCKKENRRNSTPILSFDEHKKVNVLFLDILTKGREPNEIPGLQEYLVCIKPILEELHIAGVGFVKID